MGRVLQTCIFKVNMMTISPCSMAFHNPGFCNDGYLSPEGALFASADESDLFQ
jgi:hypothetical protein